RISGPFAFLSWTYKFSGNVWYRPQLSGEVGNLMTERVAPMSQWSRPPQTAVDKDKVAASSNSSVSGTPLARVDLNKVREAKIFAVLQAQHEGCLGSFKSFDSLFGNYLVPVTPSDEFFEQIAKK
uniref:Uncharacterized protein n=1 Tax=Aegilops tauschii subsp. strangulata TaxID=200361 RepID=A0A453FFE8_AEGTS